MATLMSKPCKLQAFKFTGQPRNEFPLWAKEHKSLDTYEDEVNGGTACAIETLEGRMRVSRDDWIILGLVGEIYPCKDNVVQLKYDIVP